MGGSGSRHMRRDKYVPRGGADGSDGGRGGHVIIKADKNLWTLYHLKFKRHFRAEHGQSGGKQTSTGAAGAEVYVEVPLGTVVRDKETNEILYELIEDGEEKIVAKGSRRGRGN